MAKKPRVPTLKEIVAHQRELAKRKAIQPEHDVDWGALTVEGLNAADHGEPLMTREELDKL